MSVETLVINRLGQRGEGVASASSGTVYVPYALPDETVRADIEGAIGQLVEVTAARVDRIAPICPSFGRCGGCAVQSLPTLPYTEWKRGLVSDALRKAGISAEVAPLVDAHGVGRRRATFHARVQPSPNVLAHRKLRVGFMRARAHEVIDLAACPILSPRMNDALPAARALAAHLASLGKPVDLVMTETDAGLDADIRGTGTIPSALRDRLGHEAVRLDLARVSIHGELLLERRAPLLHMGGARVLLPPGAFLQATVQGEEVLAALVRTGVGQARRLADLFCGLGTFALRLAETATIHAVDLEGPALAALLKAASAAPNLRPVTVEARDLFRRPLVPQDLARFDTVIFDPPRAGAEAQAEALARSKVATVVAVSCNPATFARDAGLFLAGGYQLVDVTPVDQFRYSSHIELVGVFKREKTRRTRPLFG